MTDTEEKKLNDSQENPGVMKVVSDSDGIPESDFWTCIYLQDINMQVTTNVKGVMYIL